MPTTITGFEGTHGAYPSSSSGSFTVYSLPNGNNTDFANDDTHAKSGSLSGATASTTQYAGFYSSSPTSTTYLRAYYRLTYVPSNNHAVAVLFGSSFANVLMVGFGTSRQLWVVRNPDGTNPGGAALYNGSTNQLPQGAWFRVEAALTATTAHVKVWTTSPDSTGTPDIDTGSLSFLPLGTLDQVAIGAYSQAPGGGGWRTFSTYMGMDDLAFDTSTWVGPSVSVVTGNAAATSTFTGASTAAASRTSTASSVLTVTGAANAGLIVPAGSSATSTWTGSADAAVITTHSAEASPITTWTAAATATLNRSIAAAGTLTVGATAVAAQDGGADAVLQMIGAARAVVEGETSPGSLHSIVRRNVLTS